MLARSQTFNTSRNDDSHSSNELSDGAIFSLAAADRPDGQASPSAMRVELVDRTGIWTVQLKKYFSAASRFDPVDRCLQVFDESKGDFWIDIQNSLGSADLCIVFPGQLSGGQTEIFCKKLVDLIQRAKAEYTLAERPELCFVLSSSQEALVVQLKSDLLTVCKDEFSFRIEVLAKLEGKAAWTAISGPYTNSAVAAGSNTDSRATTGLFTVGKTISFNGKSSNVVDFAKLDNSSAISFSQVGAPKNDAPVDTDSSSPNQIPTTQSQGNTEMASLKESLDQVMAIDGAIAVALVDYNSGMLLGKAGSTTLNLDVAAAGNSEVVKAKQKTMKSLGLNDQIDDILITLGTQYHLIRLLPAKPGLFLYFALDKAKANLAMARYKLTEIEKTVAF